MAGILCISNVQAVEQAKVEGIKLGTGYLYPIFDMTLSHDDNIFLQESQEKSSNIVLVSPKFKYELEGEASLLSFNLNVDEAHYLSSHDDDYTDLDTMAQAAFFPSSRVTVIGSARYGEGHEARGSEGTAGATATVFKHPNEYHEKEFAGQLHYGIEELGAPRAEIELSHRDRKFDNNRAQTRSDDIKANELKASLFYKVMPNTSLLLEGAAADYVYENGTRDSKKYRLLAGLEWAATYQTTGVLKVGWSEKDFDSSNFRDPSGSSWEVGIRWRPLSYSEFTLSTSKDFNNVSAGSGSYSGDKVLALSWRHEWFGHFSTTADVIFSESKYGAIARENEINTYGLKAEYQAKQNLRFSLGYTYSERDSNQAGLDYDSNVVGLHMSWEI